MKKIFLYIYIAIAVLAIGGLLFARSVNLSPLGFAADVALPMFSSQAIGGYDAVAYFTEETATPGSAEFAHEWNGAIWFFSSGENRDLFAADPDRYAPRYGGHCAKAAADGVAIVGDPEVWAIVDDRLYLNFNTDAQSVWDQDRSGAIETADRNWSER